MPGDLTSQVKSDLLAVVEAYRAGKGWTISTFNHKAGHGTGWLNRVMVGNARLCDCDATMHWMSRTWPEGVLWPPHVRRPKGDDDGKTRQADKNQQGDS